MLISDEASRARTHSTRAPAAMATVTAIGVTALSVTLAPPVTAHAMPANPLAPPPCQQFGFAGPTTISINTVNGPAQINFTATGPHVDTTVTSPDNHNQGHLTGGIDQNGHVVLQIVSPQTLNFVGDVGDDAVARGTVSGQGTNAPWETAAPLKCVTEAVPKNAVTVDVEQSPVGVSVNVKNNSALDGRCTYDARPTNNPLLPPVHRDFELNANDSTKLDFVAPPAGATYHLVIACHGKVNGQDDEFGHHEQDVTGGL